MSTRHEHSEILRVVSSWPAPERLQLVQELLGTLASELPNRSRHSFLPALGLAQTAAPPPTDEEIKRWIEEHRVEKYG